MPYLREDEPPEWISGTFNVAKCVEYLRGIGCDVDDAQVQTWQDAEKVRRWLRGEEREVRKGCWMRCRTGHEWFGVLVRRGGKRVKAANTAASTCPECGEGWCFQSAEWVESRSGSVRDYRPMGERWKPLTGR